MIRRSKEKTIEVKKLFNGAGEAVMHRILNGADEMYGKGRGLFNDNGTEVEVGPGDVTFTGSGEGHALLNNGEEELEAIALILFR